MKKISFILVFVFLITSNVFASKKNTDLLIDLNRGITVFTKAKLQYESRQKKFNVQMPYMEIISGKDEQIKEWKVLLRKLGGKADKIREDQIIIEEASTIEDALVLDAAEEIGAVAFCNLLIYKYDNPEVNKAALKIRDQSQYYYMLYDNISQFAMLGMLRKKGMPISDMPSQMLDDEERF